LISIKHIIGSDLLIIVIIEIFKSKRPLHYFHNPRDLMSYSLKCLFMIELNYPFIVMYL